jgi:hypothetical protein
MVTRTDPSGCLAIVQAASCTLPGWAGGWVVGADREFEPAGELAPHGPIRHPENTSRLSPANIYPDRIAV